ncbi:MAG TPA: hypothetical protein VME86_17850 [Acidobacteriaceae bacterium]|nr:hypothetical protein [Acidobacteriaceae bacterium]
MPTTPSALAKKLGIKKDMRALIVNAPHGYLDLLAPLPNGVTVSRSAKGTYIFVQLFLTRQSEIRKAVSSFLKHAEGGAVVWIAYPKQTPARTPISTGTSCAKPPKRSVGAPSPSFPSIPSGPRSAFVPYHRSPSLSRSCGGIRRPRFAKLI